jgi:transcriptional regulator with XRE-family HTH domain
MSSKRPDPIDIQVGHRIRIQRVARGMSQSGLADQIGVTFQQVQKYEKGTNRVSASRLVRIAEVLGISSHALMGGEKTSEGPAVPSEIFEYLAQPGAVRLLRAYGQLANSDLKYRFVELLEGVASTAPSNEP